MCNDNDPCLVLPAIPTTTSFELKGDILLMLKDIPFSGKDYEDAFRHLDEGLDNENYFNIPNVSRDVVLLRILPVPFTRDSKSTCTWND